MFSLQKHKTWPELGRKEKTTYETNHKWLISKWAHQGMILGPPDYEGLKLYSKPFLLLIINRIQDLNRFIFLIIHLFQPIFSENLAGNLAGKIDKSTTLFS
jgi:hypothetical protein